MSEPSQQPGAPESEPRPPGLRPSAGWLIAVLLVRILVAGFPTTLSQPLRSAILLAGVAGLQIASRAWCGTREYALAALACGASAGSFVLELNAPGSGMATAMLALSLVSCALWAVLWLRRGQKH